MSDRISFAEAISERRLFANKYSKLSLPQQVVLRAFYGLPLPTEDERKVWAALQGFGRYDELGFLVEAPSDFPYLPAEYEEIVAIIGRRSGKTNSISSFICAYEALCGGHYEYVGEQEDAVIYQIADKLETAKANLRQHILPILESSPIGKNSVDGEPTADTVRLKHNLGGKTARVRITTAPPTIKVRSQAVAVCAMDELAVWPKTIESANPDFEVEEAIRPAQAQFPFRKLVKTSTPWTREGLLWTAHELGTQGNRLHPTLDRSAYTKLLVVEAPTGLMLNPRVPRSYLEQERTRKPEAFEREFLAQFSDSISGFLSHELLRAAVDRGVHERPFIPGHCYVAALDPAFRKDAFAFTIGHYEQAQGFVQDVVRHWTPTHGAVLNPAPILDEITGLLKAYRIVTAMSDQYQLESLQALAMDRGWSIEGVDFTARAKAKIYGSFQQLLNQRRLHLLDHLASLDELLKLERQLLHTGGMRISAPDGAHDDLASVLALCALRAVQLGGPTVSRAEQPVVSKPLEQLIRDTVERRHRPPVAWWNT